MNPQKKIVVPLVVIFIIFSGILPVLKTILSKWGIEYEILLFSNALFFLISLIAFFMQKKALKNPNPNVFVRSVMAGMMIKMFVCIAAVIIYRLFAGNNVSKVSVFAAMFLYLLYLGVEVAVITKLNKGNNG